MRSFILDLIYPQWRKQEKALEKFKSLNNEFNQTRKQLLEVLAMLDATL